MRLPRAVILLPFVLIGVLYAQSLANGYVYEDGNTLSMHVAHLDWPPSRSLSAWIVQTIGPSNSPAGWHLFGLGVHIATTALVGILATSWGISPLVAVIVFGLAAVQSEAIVYVSAFPDLVCTFGVVLAAIGVSSRVPSRGRLLLTIVGMGIALTAKESGVVVLGVVPLAYCRWRRSPRVTSGLIGAGTLVALVVGARSIARIVQMRDDESVSIASWAAAQATALWRAVGLCVLPIGLAIEHDYRDVPAWLQGCCLVAWLVLPAQAWRWRQQHRAAACAILWAWLAVLPRLIVVVPFDSYITEHQLYTAMVGVALGCAAWWTDTVHV